MKISIKSLNLFIQFKNNTSYEEGKIWFDKIISLLVNDSVLVDHSLGGILLAKYFLDNIFSISIKQLHVVAPMYSFEDKIE